MNFIQRLAAAFAEFGAVLLVYDWVYVPLMRGWGLDIPPITATAIASLLACLFLSVIVATNEITKRRSKQ